MEAAPLAAFMLGSTDPWAEGLLSTEELLMSLDPDMASAPRNPSKGCVYGDDALGPALRLAPKQVLETLAAPDPHLDGFDLDGFDESKAPTRAEATRDGKVPTLSSRLPWAEVGAKSQSERAEFGSFLWTLGAESATRLADGEERENEAPAHPPLLPEAQAQGRVGTCGRHFQAFGSIGLIVMKVMAAAVVI